MPYMNRYLETGTRVYPFADPHVLSEERSQDGFWHDHVRPFPRTAHYLVCQ